MVTELFSEAYMKQVYEWCDARGLKLTGHLTAEDDLKSQLTTHGACMPNYEYFHIPGMDWLGKGVRKENLIAFQLSSAAEQLGKKEVLLETFAMCGHNISFAELKGIYEWQMVHGINLLCQHLEGRLCTEYCRTRQCIGTTGKHLSGLSCESRLCSG